MDRTNIEACLKSWGITAPMEIAPLAGGTNNLAWIVREDGKQLAYVLRLTPGTDSVPRIRYEAALLQALQAKQLPFQLPLSITTQDGDILTIAEFEGREFSSSLYPLLPGQAPDRNQPHTAIQGALALAALDTALATLPALPWPADEIKQATFGELEHCHPLVPDPRRALQQLPITPRQTNRLCALLEQTWGQASALYTTLPQQLQHRDYGPANILMDQQRVTAVLDFEFAGIDLRILDLTVALGFWPSRLMGSGQEWAIIDAFGQTYVEHVPLTAMELQALPELLRLRDITSLIYRVGRYLAGLESPELICERVEHSFWREDWLLANQTILREHSERWLQKKCA